jgi:ribosomal protein L19
MLILRKLEKKRIQQLNSIKKMKVFLENPLLLSGDYILVWYINREKEKGLLRFQFNKGICMSIKYKGYNSSFQLRSIIETVAIEQQFFVYSRFNMLMLLQKNPIKRYHRNSLKFLRKKKNRLSLLKI